MLPKQSSVILSIFLRSNVFKRATDRFMVNLPVASQHFIDDDELRYEAN